MTLQVEESFDRRQLRRVTVETVDVLIGCPIDDRLPTPTVEATIGRLRALQAGFVFGETRFPDASLETAELRAGAAAGAETAAISHSVDDAVDALEDLERSLQKWNTERTDTTRTVAAEAHGAVAHLTEQLFAQLSS